ncbi:MAG: YbaB/EbfC family nucleoid-associated protein [Mycobacteriaceae bacterium]
MQPGGQPDMSQILAQAQRMQQQLMATQTELAQAEVSGQAGGGLVKAVVTGSGELVALQIDPKIVDPDDVETLQDLIIGALADAQQNAQELASKKLGPLAGGLGGGLGIPGF